MGRGFRFYTVDKSVSKITVDPNLPDSDGPVTALTSVDRPKIDTVLPYDLIGPPLQVSSTYTDTAVKVINATDSTVMHMGALQEASDHVGRVTFSATTKLISTTGLANCLAICTAYEKTGTTFTSGALVHVSHIKHSRIASLVDEETDRSKLWVAANLLGAVNSKAHWIPIVAQQIVETLKLKDGHLWCYLRKDVKGSFGLDSDGYFGDVP